MKELYITYFECLKDYVDEHYYYKSYNIDILSVVEINGSELSITYNGRNRQTGECMEEDQTLIISVWELMEFIYANIKKI